MKYRLLGTLALAGVLVLSGCGGKGIEKTGSIDNIFSNYSEFNGKTGDYGGYMFADGISAPVDIFSEAFDSIGNGWSYAVTRKSIEKKLINFDAESLKKLWGFEAPEGVEDSTEFIGMDNVIISKGVDHLYDLKDSDVPVVKGQMVEIYPNYEEVTTSQDMVVDENGNLASDETQEDAGEVEAEAKENKSVLGIFVANYGSSDTTLGTCLANGWYYIQCGDDYASIFDLKTDDGDKVSVDSIFYSMLQDKYFGDPSGVWMLSDKSEYYSKYFKDYKLSWEWSNYAIVADLTANGGVVTATNVYYIPSGAWERASGYDGIKNSYKSDGYMILDPSNLPDIIKDMQEVVPMDEKDLDSNGWKNPDVPSSDDTDATESDDKDAGSKDNGSSEDKSTAESGDSDK